MWQTGGCETGTGRPKAAGENASQRERKQRFDIVDLYEELLSKRAEMGFRPVIFISSERDLECNLIGMFEREVSEEASGEAVPHAPSVEELRRRLQ
jgi:hypothetical protein